MADEKPTTVTVETIKSHTNAGKAYEVGDTYDVDASAVENLVIQGMALRTDRVAVAKKASADAEKSTKAKRSTAVEPMSTTGKGKALAKPLTKRGRK